MENIQAAGYETITPIAITNTEDTWISTTESTTVKSNGSLLQVTA